MYHYKKWICVFFASMLSTINPMEATGLFYRTKASGFWNDPSIWETATDLTFTNSVTDAIVAPDYLERQILIRNTHTVTISESLTLDETLVEYGGALIYGNNLSSTITVADGPGIDLQIEGTFDDSGPFTITWSTPQASWMLGVQGTMIRTRSTSATLWRDHYNNGMSTIPSSSNWILRKQNADNPSISGINTYYGNLKIENTTGSFWNAVVVGSKIIGTSSAPIIKGDFEIGNSGLNGLKFYSQNSCSNRIQVKGNLIIAQGSEFMFEDASSTTGASGVDLHGNLTVNGILSYDSNDANDQNRTLLFSGNTDQDIHGSGTITLFNLQINKPSGKLILHRPISIVHKLYLEDGELTLNKNILSLLNSATDAITRADGWIKSEETDHSSVISWSIGNTSGIHEFPFGKNASQYIPFSLSITNGNVGTVSVSTYGTVSNNRPLPVLPQLVTNLDINGVDDSLYTVDRFWYLSKTDPTGTTTLSFSFGSDEYANLSNTFLTRRYNSSLDVWENPLCCQQYSSSSRTVIVPDVQNFSSWTIMEENDPLNLKNQSISKERIKFSSENVFSVYPNPFSENLYLNYISDEETPIRIEGFNAHGGKIVDQQYHASKGENIVELRFNDTNYSGLVLIKLINGSTVQEFKLQKL